MHIVPELYTHPVCLGVSTHSTIDHSPLKGLGKSNEPRYQDMPNCFKTVHSIIVCEKESIVLLQMLINSPATTMDKEWLVAHET